MILEILGRENAEAMFKAGEVHMLMEKRAVPAWLSSMAGGAKEVGGALANATGAGVDLGRSAIDLALKLGLYGLAAGTTAGVGYNLVKERLEQESPEEEFNRKLESMYAARSKELDDAKWMDKVRAMRDELRRGYRHMTTKEYSDKYNALVDALDERRS